jgi:hypothetical protein
VTTKTKVAETAKAKNALSIRFMVLSLSEISGRVRSGKVLGWGKPQEVENDAANRASEIVFSDTNGCQGRKVLLGSEPRINAFGGGGFC